MKSYNQYRTDTIKEVERELLYLFSSYERNKLLRKYNKTEDNNWTYILDTILEESIIVGNEVLYLIKGGFSEGANARLRTLHEYSNIMNFIIFNEDMERTTMRYSFYNIVNTLKNLYNEIKEEEYNELKVTFKDYIDDKEFGTVIKKVKNNSFYKIKYNWAKDFINKDIGISFSDIEKNVHKKINKLLEEDGYNLAESQKKFSRSLFRITSLNVHAGFQNYIEDVPNIIGSANTVSDDIVLENIKLPLDSLYLYLTKIEVALDHINRL